MPDGAALLDANFLIALAVAEHEHHAAAAEWFSGAGRVLLCSVVEGALVRFLLRIGERGPVAAELLAALHAHPAIEFVTQPLSYAEIDLSGLTGHRQATDAYLVALAEACGARLATFDAALARAHPDAVELIAGE